LVEVEEKPGAFAEFVEEEAEVEEDGGDFADVEEGKHVREVGAAVLHLEEHRRDEAGVVGVVTGEPSLQHGKDAKHVHL
jgi:hypothetical protein